jgi:activator of 2-hydroxyglutaryl-CoA dehydratase
LFPKFKSSSAHTSNPAVGSSNPIRIGIDVGSTTVKVVALSLQDEILFSNDRLLKVDVRNSAVQSLGSCLDEIEKTYPSNFLIQPIITGSGDLSISELISINFIQEVVTLIMLLQILFLKLM